MRKVKMAKVKYNLKLTKVIFPDINLIYQKPLLRFNDTTAMYQKFCADNGLEKEVMVFHVCFGGSSDANWNLDEYEILIHEVLNKYQVVLTFGPDEIELKEAMQKRLQDTNVVFYLSDAGIINFAKLISNFKLFVSTSTGTYHLASLVGVPTMTFFADTLFASSKRWRGVGDKSIQRNYMIPQDKQKRAELFEEIKKELLIF